MIRMRVPSLATPLYVPGNSLRSWGRVSFCAAAAPSNATTLSTRPSKPA
jgi:hypothetical protein